MITELLAGLPLVDHHCHGVVAGPVDRARMESLLGEGGPGPPGTTRFDSQLGWALRRWCAPVLDLEPHASAEAYMTRRFELGASEAARRLLDATGIVDLVLDNGFRADELLTPTQMAIAAGARTHQVARLEAVAESLAETTTAQGFADDFAAALERAARRAVGLKSIVAYRHGLDVDPTPPTAAEVTAAAGRWLAAVERGQGRLDDPVLLRHLLWTGVELGLPLQFHTGYGDADLDLHRSNPALLTGFIRAVQPRDVQVMLLHCYPFHRAAGYLAAVFPHVHMDVGLGVPGVGARSAALLAEALELTPPDKLLFSSDAFGLPELYYLGARLFRDGLAHLFDRWIGEGALTLADAERTAHLVTSGNARRVYQLNGSS